MEIEELNRCWTLLKRGAEAWNLWRTENPEVRPNLSGIRIDELCDIEFSGLNLSGSILCATHFKKTDLRNSDLRRADLRRASFDDCDLRHANLSEADCAEATLSRSLLTHSKLILVLGRFIPERKVVLEAIRQVLEAEGYVPVVFDFDRPDDRNLTETIITLASMSLFVIADITNPRCAPLELHATVPTFNIPFVPIIQEGEQPFANFKDLQSSFGQQSEGRMLELLTYPSADFLRDVIKQAILIPALERGRLLAEQKDKPLRIRRAQDYIKPN